MAKMTKAALEALLAANQSNAVGALNSTIGQHRASLMDRYNGEKYGDEVEDRSQIVMTDIRDTLESIKPELMDIFFGGDNVVEFTPQGAEDVGAAEQETDVCNYVFQQQNSGFMVLYTWFTDALMLKNGYVKRYWDERTVTEIESYDDLTPQEAMQILSSIEEENGEAEIIERWGGPEVDDDAADDIAMGMPPEGMQMAGMMQGVEMEPIGFKIRITKELKQYKIEPVPPEEILVSPLWNKLSFDGCPFVAHRSSKTVSELIEMGFDRKQVEALPEVDVKLDTEEAETRFSGNKSDESNVNAGTEIAMKVVRVYENYIMADRDGDGVAELLQVFTGGEDGEVLKRNGKQAIEEIRKVPFNAACPLPVPHKHYGLSIAELIEDLQRLRTVLVRQMVDNIVQNNNADWIIDEDRMSDATYQDMAVTRPGRNIRIPGGPASAAQVQPTQTAQQSLMGIQYVDGLREERSGVSKFNQGLDANALSKSTFGGTKAVMAASQKKILMIARIFAETAVAPMFQDMHADLRSGPLKSIAMKLNNEWVDVDPRTWKSRTDMTVNVGLGTGDRDVQFQRLGMILAQQKEAFAIGGVDAKNLHYTLGKMVELSGFKDVESFFPDPANIPPKPEQPPQPDPAMMLAQVEMKKSENILNARLAEIEIKKMEAETKRLDMMMKDHRERDLAAAKIEADEAKQFGERIDGEALTNGR